MKNTVTVRKRLFSSLSNWDVGEDAKVNLDIVSKPLSLFLKSEYSKDNSCLTGNTKLLFNLTDKNFESMTECEFWEL